VENNNKGINIKLRIMKYTINGNSQRSTDSQAPDVYVVLSGIKCVNCSSQRSKQTGTVF